MYICIDFQKRAPFFGPSFLFSIIVFVLVMVEERVQALVNEKIADRPDLFLVKVSYVPNGKVSILMDGSPAITIEDCAAISRHVGYHLEEENLIESAYHLEVSSPGLDQPLLIPRQYEKNVGRNVRLILTDGSKVEGKLLAYQSGLLQLEIKVKAKGKKAILEEREIPLKNIKETKVLISFK